MANYMGKSPSEKKPYGSVNVIVDIGFRLFGHFTSCRRFRKEENRIINYGQHHMYYFYIVRSTDLKHKFESYTDHVEYGLNQEFNSQLDLDKKGILFLLGYFCLKLSSFIRSLIYHLILSSIWNMSDSPFVCEKEVQFFLVLHMLADSSLLYKQSALRQIQ